MEQTVGGNFTEGAIVQHLAKLRVRLQPNATYDPLPEVQGVAIGDRAFAYPGARRMKSPPRVAARLLGPNPASVYTKPGAKPKEKGKSKKRSASYDDDAEDEPELYDSDDSYGIKKPRTKAVKGALKLHIKREDSTDEDTPKKRTAASKASIKPDDNRVTVAEGPAFNTRRVRRRYTEIEQNIMAEDAEDEEEVEIDHQEDKVAPWVKKVAEHRGVYEEDHPVSPKTQISTLPIRQMAPPVSFSVISMVERFKTNFRKMANDFNNYPVPANNFSFGTSEIAPVYGYNNRSFTMPSLPGYPGFQFPMASHETSFASSRTGSAMSTLGMPGALPQNFMTAPSYDGNATATFTNMYGDPYTNPFGNPFSNLSSNPFSNMATANTFANVPATANSGTLPPPWNNATIAEQVHGQAANLAGSYFAGENFNDWLAPDGELFPGTGGPTLPQMEGDA